MPIQLVEIVEHFIFNHPIDDVLSLGKVVTCCKRLGFAPIGGLSFGGRWWLSGTSIIWYARKRSERVDGRDE